MSKYGRIDYDAWGERMSKDSLAGDDAWRHIGEVLTTPTRLKPALKEKAAYNKQALDPTQDYTGTLTLNNTKYRYQNGKLHSKRYPAIEFENGQCEFWLNGESYSYSHWKKAVGEDLEARIKEIEAAQTETIKGANKTIDEQKKEIARLNGELDRLAGKKAPEEKRGDWYGGIEVD